LLSRYVERHSHPLIIFHPRDTFLVTPSEYLTLFSRFQASDIKEHPVKRSLWSCSIHLELRKSSCWHSKPRCWYTPIFILRSKYDTPPTPWHRWIWHLV
jgi:hypothetical protein